ncbi:MAG: AMP-dependent synthetase/ligase [Actinomycetota bacterium]|nr:AMP-dependent synthetase/ligase [Actinomycetota bacterium]
MSKLHDYLKSQENLITASVEGKTLLDFIDRNAEEYPDYPALNTPANREYSAWDSMSWSEYREAAKNLASGLIDLGLEPEDTAFIMSNNTKEHNISDLAIVYSGAVPSTLYKQLKYSQIEYVANLMEAKIAIVGDKELFEEVNKAKKDCPKLKAIVLINDYENYKDLDYVHSYHELINKGSEINSNDSSKLDHAISTITPDTLACLIFTSGTTGKPKGVMISHKNVLWTIESLFGQMIPAKKFPRIVSYLPMAHIAARAGDHYQAIYRVGQIFPVPVLEDMKNALPTIKPSVFLAVPRVWEKFKAGLQVRIDENPKKDLIDKAIKNGLEKVELEQAGKKVPFGIALKHKVFSKLVFSKFKDGLGISDTEYFVTAAAPMNQEVHKWFHAIDIDVTEIYGMTEDTGPATIGVPGNAAGLFSKKLNSEGLTIPKILNPIGKVGIPIPGTEVKVLEDGELCIKGNHVAQGYYKSEDQTQETFDNEGWLHTGDLAEIDDEGYVKIIGRKKEILITSAGKNIAPVELEDLIKPHQLIGQICVVGDGKKYLTALIVLDGDGGAQAWASENGVEYSIKDMSKNSKVIEAIQSQVDEANSKVAQVQQIKKFIILEKEWTDSSGELTPTMKLKRNVIAEIYNEQIESMYEGD